MVDLKIVNKIANLPKKLETIVNDKEIFDVSGRSGDKVYYVGGNIYIKQANKNTLQKEYAMTSFLNSFLLAPRVINYISSDCDWLVTEKLNGCQGYQKQYIEQPEKLAILHGESLKHLHSLSTDGCPISYSAEGLLKVTEKNYKAGKFDKNLCNQSYKNPQNAWQFVEKHIYNLKTDTLTHGDYCLPNVLYNDFKLSGFVDLGGAGINDFHFDIFWGLWSLKHNLKTDKYAGAFINAYGKDKVNFETLRVVEALSIFM